MNNRIYPNYFTIKQIAVIYEGQLSLTSAIERQMFEEYVKRKAV
jgi:hypothetical protein